MLEKNEVQRGGKGSVYGLLRRKNSGDCVSFASKIQKSQRIFYLILLSLNEFHMNPKEIFKCSISLSQKLFLRF